MALEDFSPFGFICSLSSLSSSSSSPETDGRFRAPIKEGEPGFLVGSDAMMDFGLYFGSPEEVPERGRSVDVRDTGAF
jgi:hypothetical protein